MKKYIFLPAFAALALGFAACDDDDTLGIPVTNPQLPAIEDNIVSVGASDEAPAVADLQAYNDNEQNFPVAAITATEEWPEGYGFGAVAQISRSEDFAQAFDIPAYTNGKTILLNPDDVQGVIYDNFTKDPANIDLWVRFGVLAVNGKEEIRMGNADTFYGAEKITVKPFDPVAVIEPVYYLIYSDDAETWTKAHAIAFTHNDKSQYDDPNFTLMCNFSGAEIGDGLYWKIIPQSTYETFDLPNGFVIGVTEADSESRSGKLDISDDQLAGWFDITGPAMFEVKLDFVSNANGEEKALTFKYLQAIQNFWLAGDNVNGQTWSFGQPTMFTFNYVDYAGVANLGTQFKFSPTNGWNGDFGSDGGLSVKDNGGQVYAEGFATGSNNINVPEPGFYYISLNYATKALSILKIESMGIIGGFNGWNASVDMVASDNNFVYTLNGVELNEGDQWKFRANGQWTFSIGGDFDNLSPFNGANFECKETGTYDIRLDMSTLPWTATVVKK